MGGGISVEKQMNNTLFNLRVSVVFFLSDLVFLARRTVPAGSSREVFQCLLPLSLRRAVPTFSVPADVIQDDVAYGQGERKEAKGLREEGCRGTSEGKHGCRPY